MIRQRGLKERGQERSVVLLLLLCMAYPSAISAQGRAEPAERALVLTVQPFRTSSEPAFSYLGESFSEALTTKLVGLKQVRIYERSQFDKLASELRLERDASGMFDSSTLSRTGAVVSIDYVLLGSVTQSGSSVACNVRLVQVNTGRVVLAKDFRGSFPTELFGLQDSVAMAVASALSIGIGDLELKRLGARPTTDADAYGFYNRSLVSADQAERVKLLESATTRDPGFVMAWHLLADAYMSLGRPERAEYAYTKILELDPGDYRALYNRALLRLDDGDYEEARRGLTTCIDLKPADADALYNLGFSWEFSPAKERFGAGSDVDKALELYRAAQSADQKHAESRLAGGTLCAIIAQAEPDPSRRLALLRESRASLSEYLELRPGSIDAAEIATTLESISAAIVEHEQYLDSCH